MKLGTPGFVGARLREAREARGLSGASLADLLDVSRQAIALYENDERSPSPEMVGRMSTALNLPQPFFLRPVVEDHATTIFFRSRVSATKNARKKARTRRKWLDEITQYIAQSIELPSVNFPPCDFPADPVKISNDDIERAATSLRRFWRLGDGPISDVTLLAENNGAIVAREPFDDEKVDAHSAWAYDIPFIVLSADKQSAVRSRYDVAHELGHIVLHRNVDDGRLESRKADQKLTEDQANWFAGAFLLPHDTFANDLSLPTLDAIVALKPKWKVSVSAMIMRAKHLGLISPERVDRLWISYGRRKWQANEPYDDQLPIEHPRLLSLAFDLALSERVIVRDETLNDLAFTPSDIESLVGLPRGTFSDDLPSVRILQAYAGRTESGERRANTKSGEVVPFPNRKRSEREM